MVKNYFLLTLFFLLFIAAFILGFAGLLPGVSKLFGADKPKDLGIKYSVEDLQSADQKTGIKIVILPLVGSPQESLSYSGNVNVNTRFTSEELTASINRWFEKWKYFPLSDCQIKINADNSVEISGIFRTDRVYGYLAAAGYDQKDIERVLGTIDTIKTNPPFYVKSNASIKDNTLSLDIEKIMIGKLSLPSFWIKNHQKEIAQFLEEDRINRIPKVDVRNLNFEAGTMKFEGVIPQIEATINE